MTQPAAQCVLLADRHHGLIERVRDLLESEFATLFIVADKDSLIDGATRLLPAVAIVDTALVPGELPGLLDRIRKGSPETKILLLSLHDEASVARFALEARADGVVLKREIASDLPDAIRAVLENRRFVSPAIRLALRDDDPDASEEEFTTTTLPPGRRKGD